MTTSFDNAIAGAMGAVRASAGRAVTYRRGGAEASLTAVAGQTRVDIEDASGLSIRSRRRDWIVRAADLALDGEVITPEVGDQILLTVGEGARVFEVQRPAGEGAFQAMDDQIGRASCRERVSDYV